MKLSCFLDQYKQIERVFLDIYIIKARRTLYLVAAGIDSRIPDQQMRAVRNPATATYKRYVSYLCISDILTA
jgi:hypothetical protein